MSERVVRIRRISDLGNAPRMTNGAYNLVGAYLRRANLDNADLTGANLQGASLLEADMSLVNLSGANLRGADLRGAYLKRANLQGANLEGAKLDDSHALQANLTGANLSGADLRAMNLNEATLNDVILDENTKVNIYTTYENITASDDVVNMLNQLKNANLPVAPVAPATSVAPVWTQDESCVGQQDPVSLEPIPDGRGLKLDAENGYCYDVKTLSEMKRLGRPLIGPRTRNQFSDNDKKRINAYDRENPRGGNKKINKTNKKRKTKRSKKSKKSKKRNTMRKA